MPHHLRRALITFSDDVSEDAIDLHHRRTPLGVIPELVRDHASRARRRGARRTVASVVGRRTRLAIHQRALDEVSALEGAVLTTNGGQHEAVFEIRAYATRVRLIAASPTPGACR